MAVLLLPAGPALADGAGLWRIQATLSALDGEEGNRFGGNPAAIAIDGDTAVVGALSSNSAYVFVRRGGAWSEQARLVPPAGAGWEQFGWAVALSGDLALIAANLDGGWFGVVHVFRREGDEWTNEGSLSATDGGAFHAFGNALVLSGNTALIGAAGGLSALPGSVYVFEYEDGVWNERQKLIASDAAGGDHFGGSIALSGNIALIGARKAVVGENDKQGAAYLFARKGELWVEQEKLTAADGFAGQRFGHMVALDDDTALIGAPAIHGNNIQGGTAAEEEPGAAYIFSRAGDEWHQQARLDAAVEYSDGFGYTLALAAGKALIGAPLTDMNGFFDQGAAYLYSGDGGDWSVPVRLEPPTAAGDEWFGFGVAFQGDALIVGKPGAMSAGITDIEGTVHVFGKVGDALFADRYEQ